MRHGNTSSTSRQREVEYRSDDDALDEADEANVEAESRFVSPSTQAKALLDAMLAGVASAPFRLFALAPLLQRERRTERLPAFRDVEREGFRECVTAVEELGHEAEQLREEAAQVDDPKSSGPASPSRAAGQNFEEPYESLRSLRIAAATGEARVFTFFRNRADADAEHE